MTISTIRTLSLLIVFSVFLPAQASAGSVSTPGATKGSGAQASSSSGPAKNVLATVNGTPITDLDVKYKLNRERHSAGSAPRPTEEVLETIIREEICYQKAVALGLDADLTYVERLRQFEVQLNFFKRKELTELFIRRQIEGQASITDAEAAKYFAANASRLRTELHIWQILRRDEAAIQQALKDLAEGKPFEAVAAQQLPQLPESARKPWDLGYLKWNQIPDAWREVVYDLKTGAVSGVIRGPKGRFWILKLVDRREDPAVTFENIRPVLVEKLKAARIEEVRERVERDLRKGARVVYTADQPRPAE